MKQRGREKVVKPTSEIVSAAKEVILPAVSPLGIEVQQSRMAVSVVEHVLWTSSFQK